MSEYHNMTQGQLTQVAYAIDDILRVVGEDGKREGLVETPKRAAKAWAELTRGLREDPAVHFKTFEAVEYKELILVRDIPFVSMCEHHLLPFMGVAHIGYIPDGRILGLSKFARIMQCCAAKPHVQEKLTMEVANLMVEHLHPLGAMVVVSAEHTCMSIRGVKAVGSKTVTSAVTGVFKDPTTGARAEFLNLLGGSA